MSSEKTSLSVAEIRSLYEAAIRFQALQPWNSMEDSDLFGVQDPVSGEVGYCCRPFLSCGLLSHPVGANDPDTALV